MPQLTLQDDDGPAMFSERPSSEGEEDVLDSNEPDLDPRNVMQPEASPSDPTVSQPETSPDTASAPLIEL